MVYSLNPSDVGWFGIPAGQKFPHRRRAPNLKYLLKSPGIIKYIRMKYVF